ncbi:ragulator complex protein LAMTOR4 [Heterodontus francisci]|uniref:ragulator complex protein LAMTOR4 n=1 Tax=Heterodontus francisci TaxID=7792 RepID=UPI00355C8538
MARQTNHMAVRSTGPSQSDVTRGGICRSCDARALDGEAEVGVALGFADMASALTQGLERIPDQLGYLVISEDGVLSSAGELENDEHAAGVIMRMMQTAVKLCMNGNPEPFFKRMSVVFGEHTYMATISGQKVFVVKRHNNPHEAVEV